MGKCRNIVEVYLHIPVEKIVVVGKFETKSIMKVQGTYGSNYLNYMICKNKSFLS